MPEPDISSIVINTKTGYARPRLLLHPTDPCADEQRIKSSDTHGTTIAGSSAASSRISTTGNRQLSRYDHKKYSKRHTQKHFNAATTRTHPHRAPEPDYTSPYSALLSQIWRSRRRRLEVLQWPTRRDHPIWNRRNLMGHARRMGHFHNNSKWGSPCVRNRRVAPVEGQKMGVFSREKDGYSHPRKQGAARARRHW